MGTLRGLVALASIAPLLAACSGTSEAPAPEPSTPSAASPAATTPPEDSPQAGPSEAAAPTGEPRVVAEGLDAPWSVLRLEEWTVVSQRDAGTILGISPEGDVAETVAVEGVDAGGEGGLLGLAHAQIEGQDWLYAYYTSATDNRVVRYRADLGGEPSVAEREDVITGIPKASNHNGGRIAFGPDGRLYVATGDAAQGDSAQDPDSLAGKILRLNPDGSTPDDNPGGSPVYSLGHRNPQGLAWDADGTLWASEFGQDTYDELNRIEPGGNYGWPEVEGPGDGGGDFVEPVRTWATSEASPSGLTFASGAFYLAGLGGQRLFGISSDGGTEEQFLGGELGRIRDVAPGPDGALWVLTNNTDGRGDPGPSDDRLLEYDLG